VTAAIHIPAVPPPLRTIAEKVHAGVRLDEAESVEVFRSRDLLALGALANVVRERLHGDRTFYNRNFHLNATNVCEASCRFCAFARLEEGMPEAKTFTVPEAVEFVKSQLGNGPTEVHIVNGLHPGLPFSYYEELLRAIKETAPRLHIKGFTAVEIHYYAEKYGMTYEQVLAAFRTAGLGSMPGGGAEIFAARVRRKICKDKADAGQWLEVHRVAHRMGIRSNCTMLYGTVETPEERADHVLRLRALQDETSGFQAFIPLAFHRENSPLQGLPEPTGFDNLLIYAQSRLVLDNVPHLKAYWVMVGEKTAQVALSFGADDLDGTVVSEKIYKMAGSHSPGTLSVDGLRRLIREAGRTPIERDTLYNVLEVPLS
jgi:aminodeoxyfutalosine synthase